jgi:hypothetical protein
MDSKLNKDGRRSLRRPTKPQRLKIRSGSACLLSSVVSKKPLFDRLFARKSFADEVVSLQGGETIPDPRLREQ